ncbi:MAG: hypothetical protein PVI83_09290 [Lysobacterales bacterium]|jgi:hypothetical protein
MTWLAVCFGSLLALAGVLLLVRPGCFIAFIEGSGEQAWFYYSAVGGRAVLGLLLIRVAAVSRYPLVIEILGWVILAAALILALLGRAGFSRLLDRMMGWLRSVTWLAGIFAMFFGGFLVYAFVP